MNQHNCKFCNILGGSEDLFTTNPFVKKGLKIPYKSNNLIVIPDAAPLGYGHCLIIPQHHVLNIATIDKNNRKEILNLIEKIIHYQSRFVNISFKPYYFEHGSTSEDEKTGCSTVHAHFHIFFAPPDLGNGTDLDGFQKFNEIADGWNKLAGHPYYLLGEFGKTTWGCKVNEHPLLKCSMFVRKIFSYRLGRPNLADYRRYSKPLAEVDEWVESIYETYKNLKELRGRHQQQILPVVSSK